MPSSTRPYPRLPEDASRLVRFLCNPGPNVWRAVAKLDAICFAGAQELDNVSIHQHDILEIQHKRPTRRFRIEQRGEFAHVVCLQSTAYRQHNLAISATLDSQHESPRE